MGRKQSSRGKRSGAAPQIGAVGKSPPSRAAELTGRRTTARVSEAAVALLPATALSPSVAEMIDAGMDAFWELAERWRLSATEQNALLNISDSTRLRWRRAHPSEGEALLDRLQLILLTYQRLNEMTGTDAEAATLLRRKGSAMSPDVPGLTVLEALGAPSILEMQRHYQRLESDAGAW